MQGATDGLSFLSLSSETVSLPCAEGVSGFDSWCLGLPAPLFTAPAAWRVHRGLEKEMCL